MSFLFYPPGSTVTLAVIMGSVVAAIAFPAAKVKARVGISAGVSAAGILVSSLALHVFGTVKVDLEVRCYTNKATPTPSHPSARVMGTQC